MSAHLEVIRLTTSYWADRSAIHVKRTIRILRRKSSEHTLLDEEVSMIGADLAIPKIVNLHECEDGIYEVQTCNESRDYDTGHIDDYDFKLVPHIE